MYLQLHPLVQSPKGFHEGSVFAVYNISILWLATFYKFIWWLYTLNDWDSFYSKPCLNFVLKSRDIVTQQSVKGFGEN